MPANAETQDVGKNVWSFEFCERGADGLPAEASTLGEYFLLVGLTAYKEQFRYRISIEPTFGGSSLVDYGNDNNVITLNGEMHIYSSGKPPSSGDSGSLVGSFDDGIMAGIKQTAQNVASAALERAQEFASEVAPLPGIDSWTRTGAMEFHDFVGLLYHIRNPDNPFTASSDTQATKITTAMKNKKTLAEYAIIFHDYGRDRHVEVAPPRDGITISRSVEDTNTYRFEMQLVVLRDMKSATFVQDNIFDRLKGLSPSYAITRLIAAVESAIHLPLQLSGSLLGLVNTMQSAIIRTRGLVDQWDSMTDQFRADGMAISQGWEGVKREVSEATGRGKKSLSERLADAENDVRELRSEISSSRANLAEIKARAYEAAGTWGRIADELTALIVAPVGSLEQDSQLPYADWTEVVENTVYQMALEVFRSSIQIAAEITIAETDNQFEVITASAGDSWASLAERMLGDRSLAAALAAYNLSNETTNPQGPVKIPRTQNSFVYAKMPLSPQPADLERAILGEDLALTEQRDFEVAPNGDLAVIAGEAALSNNIIDIIDTPQGSLPSIPEYGNPIKPGELEETWLKEAYLYRLVKAIRLLPQITNCQLVSSVVDGNRIAYTLRIQTIHDSISWFLDV
jgi:hypothetical protein